MKAIAVVTFENMTQSFEAGVEIEADTNEGLLKALALAVRGRPGSWVIRQIRFVRSMG